MEKYVPQMVALKNNVIIQSATMGRKIAEPIVVKQKIIIMFKHSFCLWPWDKMAMGPHDLEACAQVVHTLTPLKIAC